MVLWDQPGTPGLHTQRERSFKAKKVDRSRENAMLDMASSTTPEVGGSHHDPKKAKKL